MRFLAPPRRVQQYEVPVPSARRKSSEDPASECMGAGIGLEEYTSVFSVTSYGEGVSTKYPQPTFGIDSYEGISRDDDKHDEKSAEEELPRAERLCTHRLLESPLEPQLWSLILRSIVWWFCIDEDWNEGVGIMLENREQSSSNSWESEVELLIMVNESISGGEGKLPLESIDSLFIWNTNSKEFILEEGWMREINIVWLKYYVGSKRILWQKQRYWSDRYFMNVGYGYEILLWDNEGDWWMVGSLRCRPADLHGRRAPQLKFVSWGVLRCSLSFYVTCTNNENL